VNADGPFFEILVTLSLAMLIFSAVWWSVGWPVAMLHRALAPRLEPLSAVPRVRLLTYFSALPTIIALVISLLLFSPELGGRLVSEHCHGEIGCEPHVPGVGSRFVAIALAGFAALIFLTATRRLLVMISRHTDRLRQLRQLATRSPVAGYRLIDSEIPFALTVGLWRPEVFVSSALTRRLDARQLSSVLAHERAHVRRRDTLRMALIACCAPAALSGSAQPLMRQLRRASEECCDASAARLVQDPLAVADALIQSQRALSRATVDQAPGGETSRSNGRPTAAPSDLALRVARLIEEPQSVAALSPVLMLTLSLLIGVIALFGINLVHHGAEMVLAVIDR
jgi:Zn-dependent protease with chaperone function